MRRILVGTAVLAGCGAVLVAARPIAASPAMAPGFTDYICHAKPPRLVHDYARGITVVPPGSVIRAAAATISNEDHAELMLKLGLMQGHLMIGRELLDAKQEKLALPHFGHPVRELYEDVSDALKARGLSPFDGELIALEAMVAGKPHDAATLAKYDEVMKVLAAVRATIPASLQDNERFTLGVLGEVAAVASEDYSESVEGGKITKPVEYHDSRGYLEFAAAELARLGARPELKASPRLAAARARLKEMQAIVGPLLPPQRPVKTVAQYKGIVAQFKKETTATGA